MKEREISPPQPVRKLRAMFANYGPCSRTTGPQWQPRTRIALQAMRFLFRGLRLKQPPIKTKERIQISGAPVREMLLGVLPSQLSSPSVPFPSRLGWERIQLHAPRKVNSSLSEDTHTAGSRTVLPRETALPRFSANHLAHSAGTPCQGPPGN